MISKSIKDHPCSEQYLCGRVNLDIAAESDPPPWRTMSSKEVSV